MRPDSRNILTLNGGSSSIKFSIFSIEEELTVILSGQIGSIGLKIPELVYKGISDDIKQSIPIQATGFSASVNALIAWLETRKEFKSIAAIGQRIVHGMEITKPQLITDDLMESLGKISRYDPDHLPGEMELIKSFRQKLPQIPQIACFDTAFHQTIPTLATLLPIPRKYKQMGIRKYGFHGLSFSFIMEAMNRMKVPAASKGRVLIAHLGNGASMAAVLDGNCIDTSMGFTPTGGLMMGTRSGDLDPGLVSVIMLQESMNAEKFNGFVNHDCGLLGLSETSSDMQVLLSQESVDFRAAEAIHLFCYQAKKWIGSFTAVLKGLDVLVFTGGIGENAVAIRARICEGLEFMGIRINPKENERNAEIISSEDSRVAVYVIPTNEEYMIAKMVNDILSK